MKLKEFIQKMEEGWNLRDTERAKAIGRALKKVANKEDMDKEVDVEFRIWKSKGMETISYHYEWVVNGAKLNCWGGRIYMYSDDELSAYYYDEMPILVNTENGFKVGYEDYF